MANRINSVKRTTTNYQAPVVKDGKLSYSLYDSAGKKVGQTYVDPGTDMTNASNKYFIKGEDGSYKMSDTPSTSLSLNKETGNVSIKAPKSFLESAYYKQQLKPTLEQYSQAYKLNPKAMFPVSSEEGAEEHDVKWYIEQANNDLANLVVMEDLRKTESNKAGQDLDFDDLKVMNSAAVTYKDASGEEHKVSDTDRQVIPKIPEANFLREAFGDAFDETTNTIDYKTLMEKGWNRERQSDEDIIKLKEAVDDYFSRGDFSDKELYTQMYAFKNFIDQTPAHTGFFRGLADFVNNVWYGALTGAASFWTNVMDVTEAGFNAVGRFAGGDKYQEMTFVKDYLKPEYENLKNQHISRAQQLNPAGAATFTVANVVAPMAIQMAAGRGLAKAITDGVTAIGTVRAAKLAKDAMESKDFAERTVSQIFLGTDLMMNSMNATQAAQVTVASLQNLSAIQQAVSTGGLVAKNVSVIINGTKVAAWAAEIAADAVIDSALGRPDVVRKILDGDNDADKNLLLKELGMNLVFWGGMRATGKVTKAVKQTDIGRTATALVAPKVNALSVKVGKASDKIKDWVFGDNWKEELLAKRNKLLQPGGNAKKAKKLTNKIKILASRDTTRKQQEILSKMRVFTGESDEVMDNVKAIEKQMRNVKAAQLMWDDSNLKRAAGNWFNTFTNSDFDPEFKGSFDKYINDLSVVINAENAIGFGEDMIKNKALTDIGDKGIRILDQRTANYIGAKIQLSYGVERSDITLADLREKIKVFQEAASPELITAADGLVESYRDVYAKFQKLGTDPDFALNLYNVNELDELRNAKNAQKQLIFGENGSLYAKTMRVDDLDEYGNFVNRGVVKNKSNILSQSLDYDATGDFVDPTYVLVGEISEKSKVAATQANANILSELPGVNTEVVVGGGATEQLRLYKKTPNYGTTIKSKSKSVYEDFTTSGVTNDIFDQAKATSYVLPRTGFAPGNKAVENVDKIFDDYLESVGRSKAGRSMASNFSTHAMGGKEADYMALTALSNDSVEFLDNIEASARKEFKSMLESADGFNKKDVDKVADQLAKDTRELFQDRLDIRVADLTGELVENGSTIVDRDRVYDSITELMGEIEGAKKATNVVKLYDIQGRETFVKMDPLLADMFNTRPLAQDMSSFQKINNLWNRTFRLGTTGANLRSFMAQNVKDFGNAFIGGGADRTIKEVARHLTDELGENIVEQIEQFEPRIYQQLSKQAAETGEGVAQLAVQRELSIGRAVSPSATESEAFKFMTENRAARFGGKGEYYSDAYSKVSDKLDKVIGVLERPQEAREVWLRNMSYSNAFSDAIESGSTIKDARLSARFLMNNATTNFGREMYHLNNLRNSVPYLGAAVNGTKSFWRLFALDPVGVTGRLMGGIVLPMVYLTGQSLATEENKRIWNNIPEYQKDGNIVFITNGQIVSIPIPEEIGGIINPVRQFVEHLNGVDPKSFQELMINDLIGLQPFNLDGFVMYDRNRLLGDPTIWDRISAGTSKFASQVMPPMLKSAVIYATGKDPYTGKEIPRDRVVIDPDTGEETIMDYTVGSFSKWLSGVFGDNLSAPMAQKLLQNLIGNAGVDIVNGVWGLGQQIVKGDWQGMLENPELLQNLTDQITAPFTIEKYSLANSQWTQAISQLNKRKEEILNDETYQNAIKGMKNAKTDDEYNKYKTIKQNILDEYYQEVLDVSSNLVKYYPNAFDSSKYAAVIQLMNMDATTYGRRTGNAGENAYNDWLHEELESSGKNAAVSTMAELGFKSASPASIFGYYFKDDNGDVVTIWNDPVNIMNMRKTISNADDIHWANIHAAVRDNNLWDKKENYRSQVKAIYDKGKMSSSDYDAVDAIWVAWNAEVMNAINPYIQRMTPEQAINNTKVLNELASLIEPPGEFKVDKRGRHVTNKSLGEGNAKQAYVRNYIKKIYKINDTGYTGGKNYSDRK